MKFLILNGPNLNLLGRREPEIYGKRDYAALANFVAECCASVGAECEVFQTNHEGVLVDMIQGALETGVDAIIINPAAYTHTSIAIADALRAVEIPAAEVHLSDINARETYRHISYAGDACIATFKGKGFDSYREAIEFMSARLAEK